MAADLSFTIADVSANWAAGAILADYKAATGKTLNVGDCIAPDGNTNSVDGIPTAVQADGNDANFQVAEAVGVVANSTDWYGATAIAAGQNASVVVAGPVYLPGANMIPGATYYVSDNAGKISDTASGTHAWIIGHALDADTLFVAPHGTGSGNY